MGQLVKAEANSGNGKALLASNYYHAALRECIMYKQLNYARTLIPSDTRSNARVDVCVLSVVLRGCQWTIEKGFFRA